MARHFQVEIDKFNSVPSNTLNQIEDNDILTQWESAGKEEDSLKVNLVHVQVWRNTLGVHAMQGGWQMFEFKVFALTRRSII